MKILECMQDWKKYWTNNSLTIVLVVAILLVISLYFNFRNIMIIKGKKY